MNSNILENTMAEMNWCDIEELAGQNALVLLPVGVMEEHGRHLPIGTDIYMAAAQAKFMADEMREQGFPCVIAPPLYWGICSVLTRHFPGSFTLQPDTLRAVVRETLECLEKAGFRRVVLVNAHGDPGHRGAITGALQEYNAAHALQAKWLTFRCDWEFEGFTGEENCLLVLPERLFEFLGGMDGQLEDNFDVHAGAYETSAMLEVYPELTDIAQAKRETATKLSGDEIGRWLGGKPEDKSLIPMGYVGSPAAYQQIHSTTEKYCREMAGEIMKYYR